jgi:lipopolysaccharide/colanic/teichoic acid biosynthesis glycosyltransferase
VGWGTGVAKRLIDVTAGLAALVVFAPLIAVAALAVRLTMGRPVLHHDERIGRGDRPFRLVKLRTMRPLRPGETIPESDHLRITRVGGLLRSSSIDELVSLVSVVKGEMSLVGPRPLPVRYLQRYTPEQRRRHEVRPGMTGLAQVRGRNGLSWDDKLALDVWYVDHASIRLDLRILRDTLAMVLGRRGIDHDDGVTMPEFAGPSPEAGAVGRPAAPASGTDGPGRRSRRG